jgi:hypothetical protein
MRYETNNHRVATIIMTITAITATTATTIPIQTFLFFHHILFLTFLDVSRISND